MADAIKEKNMPTISSNVYGGLQKWVNRASVSLRGRRRSRNNSDASVLTRNQHNHLENMASKPTKITPVHGRSRSTPVDMPEDSSTFETFPQKIPQVVKQTKSERRRKYSSEHSDDSSSRGSLHEAKDMSALNRRLSNNLSKSESNLLDGRYSRRSESLPKPSFGRRKASLCQVATTDSKWSELDSNNHSKKSQSLQTLDKTNKKDKHHSSEHKANSIGANKPEISQTITQNTSKNVHTRLDMWLENTRGFKDSRQSSFESTSSSEELFYESKARQDETKHFRDLQTALDELVSSCGKRNSIVMDNKDTSKRKISLKDAGPMFNKTVEFDHSLQEERKTTYRKERGGSSSDSGLPKEHGDTDGKIEEKYNVEERYDLESSYDSVDGCVDRREGHHIAHSSKDSDIGPNMNVTRATNIIGDHSSSEVRSTTKDTSNLSSINNPIKNGRLPAVRPKENINFDNKANLLPKDDNSTKNSLSHNAEKESKKAPTAVFDDDDLAAFAMKCVEASKSLERAEDKRNKSDSDDEKKTALDLDYVYIPKKNVKSSTHPVTTFDKKGLPQNALSDDESYTTNREKHTSHVKRNSQDSLDGLVLFDLQTQDIDFDNNESKYHSSNETDNNKNTLKVDHSGYGLRKFPSMPLFYVPNDGTRKSLGKSLWKRIKSIPRSTENRASSPSTQKTEHSQSVKQTDPFYHGENDQELGPKTRPKSNSMANGEARKRNRRRRLSLEVRRSAPADSGNAPSENTKSADKQIMNGVPMESQC